LDIFLQGCNRKFIHNHASKVAVVVPFARPTIFEGVAAKEKLADIAADTMIDHKFAARMLIYELVDLHDQIVD
jgi:hypothetical protein